MTSIQAPISPSSRPFFKIYAVQFWKFPFILFKVISFVDQLGEMIGPYERIDVIANDFCS